MINVGSSRSAVALIPLSAVTKPFDVDSAKVYRPAHARRGAGQGDRYFELTDDIHGLNLARISGLSESSEYHVVDVAEGRVVALSVELSHDVRRLMYGLDAPSGDPTFAQWSKADAAIQFRVTSAIPAAETRALVALAERPHDRTWTIHGDVATLRLQLTGLGIERASGSIENPKSASHRAAIPGGQPRRCPTNGRDRSGLVDLLRRFQA